MFDEAASPIEMTPAKLLLREETVFELAEIELTALPDCMTPNEAKSFDVLILFVGTAFVVVEVVVVV